MYFISGHTWLFKTAFAIPLRFRYFLTCIVWITIIGFWYVFAYQSLIGLENHCTKTIKTLEDQVNQIHREQKQLNMLEQSCIQKKKVIYDYFQHQKSFEKKIEKILHLLQEYNLSLYSCNPSNEIKKEWYTKVSTFFKIEGKFKDVISFLPILSQASLITNISSLDMQKIQDGLLQISLLLDIIILHEEKHV